MQKNTRFLDHLEADLMDSFRLSWTAHHYINKVLINIQVEFPNNHLISDPLFVALLNCSQLCCNLKILTTTYERTNRVDKVRAIFEVLLIKLFQLYQHIALL